MLVISIEKEISQATENISKVAYAFGLIQDQLGSSLTGEKANELDWDDIYAISQMIYHDWNNFNDIKYREEEGYIIPYAIRKWNECFNIKKY